MEVVPKISLIWYLVGYGVIMVVMGIVYSRKIATSEDFILAGRGLGGMILIGTLLATWMGSGTVTGGSASLAYKFGFWPAMINGIGSPLAMLVFILIAGKIRAYGKYTISGILTSKYGEFSRILSSFIVILAYLGICSYQFKGFGYVLNVSTGISTELGTLIGLLLIIFLATAGGLMTVAPTDALSSYLMLASLIIAVPFMTKISGGWANVVANVPASHLTTFGGLTPLQYAGYFFPVIFLLLGDQNMYQRLSAASSKTKIKIVILSWAAGTLVVTPMIAYLSFVSSSIFPNISPGMSLIATTTILPTFVAGILLAGIAAFIITTGNSYLLSAATSFTYDAYKRYFRPDAKDKELLNIIRITIPAFGILAWAMIRYFPSILAIQMYSYTVYGAGITPALLAIFLWKGVTKAGGISSMLGGIITTLTWEIVLKRPGNLNSIVIAVPVAIILLVVVSLLTQNQNKDQKIISK